MAPTACNSVHMTIYERMTSNILDPRERELALAVLRAGDEYDAATDGSLHHAYPAHVADAKYDAIKRTYDRAARALIGYRRNVAQYPTTVESDHTEALAIDRVVTR